MASLNKTNFITLTLCRQVRSIFNLWFPCPVYTNKSWTSISIYINISIRLVSYVDRCVLFLIYGFRVQSTQTNHGHRWLEAAGGPVESGRHIEQHRSSHGPDDQGQCSGQNSRKVRHSINNKCVHTHTPTPTPTHTHTHTHTLTHTLTHTHTLTLTLTHTHTHMCGVCVCVCMHACVCSIHNRKIVHA